MSERAKLGLLCLLFLFTLGIAVLMIANSIQAVHDFQQQDSAIKAGDVSTIRPWMTIHVISRLYHVPDTYLDQSLSIARTDPLQRETLYEIAINKRQPVEQIIHKLQQSILTYRKEYSHFSIPTQQLSFYINSSVPAPEETKV